MVSPSIGGATIDDSVDDDDNEDGDELSLNADAAVLSADGPVVAFRGLIVGDMPPPAENNDPPVLLFGERLYIPGTCNRELMRSPPEGGEGEGDSSEGKFIFGFLYILACCPNNHHLR